MAQCEAWASDLPEGEKEKGSAKRIFGPQFAESAEQQEGPGKRRSMGGQAEELPSSRAASAGG